MLYSTLCKETVEPIKALEIIIKAATSVTKSVISPLVSGPRTLNVIPTTIKFTAAMSPLVRIVVVMLFTKFNELEKLMFFSTNVCRP